MLMEALELLKTSWQRENGQYKAVKITAHKKESTYKWLKRNQKFLKTQEF